MKQYLVAMALSLSATWAMANSERYINHGEIDAFLAEMVTEHQFTHEELQTWFSSATKKQVILDAISRPAEKTKTWGQYRKIFITESRITKGVEFWRKNEQILQQAAQEFGVPAEIIVAIIGVETLYGRNKGSFRVIDALSTLAFDYPRRSQFFRSELEAFLLLAREQKQDPLSLFGSYAGAMGYGQFIPSSYRAYAIDYDGDGFADIWNNTHDAIGSVANYFKRHGWKSGAAIAMRSRVEDGYEQAVVNQSLTPKATVGELVGQGFIAVNELDQSQKATAMRLQGEWGTEYWLGLHNFYVITRYNHSRLYAMAVWQLSQEIAQARNSRS